MEEGNPKPELRSKDICSHIFIKGLKILRAVIKGLSSRWSLPGSGKTSLQGYTSMEFRHSHSNVSGMIWLYILGQVGQWASFAPQSKIPPATVPASIPLSVNMHSKKRLMIFPSPAGMSLTKLSLAGKNLIIPARESLVSDNPAGDGKIDNLFLQGVSLRD